MPLPAAADVLTTTPQALHADPAAPVEAPAPTLLPLVDQMDFTAGLCSAFAVAAQRLFPAAQLQVLVSEDPRHLNTHDWPEDLPMLVHAFVALPDGQVLDAEGLRSRVEMAASFGVRRTYRQRVDTLTPEGLNQELPFHEDRVLDALATMREHGWGPQAPTANGELTRRWKATRKAQTERGSRPPRPLAPVPTALDEALVLAAVEPSIPASPGGVARSPRPA